MTFSVVYASSATALLSRDELEAIMRSCRARNEELGVTGALLYRDGNVMQVLEGDEETVRDLYAKIKSDPRHTGVITLVEESIPERRFPEWSMAFKDITRLDLETPGFSDFLNTPVAAAEFGPDPSLSQRWLMIFKEGFAGGG